jgi:hypothetical protein
MEEGRGPLRTARCSEKVMFKIPAAVAAAMTSSGRWSGKEKVGVVDGG